MQNSHPKVERTAWAVLIASFITFCVLAISIPLTVRWYLLTNEVAQEVSISLVSGTVFLVQPGAARPEAVVETISGLAAGAQIESGSGAQAAVSFVAPDKTTVLGGLQIYGGTRVALGTMRSPRFNWSDLPHRIVIEMQSGRARVNVASDVPRQVTVALNTPHGMVLLDRPGSYSVEVTDKATEVAVREGIATVYAQEENVALATGERTLIPAGKPPQGILTGERNLIINGDFAESLSPDWTVYQDRSPGDVLGEIIREPGEDRNVVHFVRPGTNWGRTGVRQVINRDVRDYKTLRLQLAARLIRQDVLACGSQGSECPLMIKIEYADVAGNNREWVQGFYYLTDPANKLPTLCVTCPAPTTEHKRIQRGGWYLYESPDLIELFKKTGVDAAIIKAISIYAEGHIFESYFSEVELLAGD